MNPLFFAAIGKKLMGAQRGLSGLGQKIGQFGQRTFQPPARTHGATLPNNPLRQPSDMTGVGRIPMRPPILRMDPMPRRDFQPMQPMDPIIERLDPGFQPAQPRFPGDPGIDPGMTPPQDESGYGPVPLGGARRRRWQFGQGGGGGF